LVISKNSVIFLEVSLLLCYTKIKNIVRRFAKAITQNKFVDKFYFNEADYRKILANVSNSKVKKIVRLLEINI
jgi:hypothetical protein